MLLVAVVVETLEASQGASFQEVVVAYPFPEEEVQTQEADLSEVVEVHLADNPLEGQILVESLLEVHRSQLATEVVALADLKVEAVGVFA